MVWILSVRLAVGTTLGMWLYAYTIFHHGYAWSRNSSWQVYLRPLVEELLLLWREEGVRMWDEYKQEDFNLWALFFVTINDYHALSNLSRQSNKGYRACTYCLEDSDYIRLTHCRKVVYMGHRRFRHVFTLTNDHFQASTWSEINESLHLLHASLSKWVPKPHFTF